MGAIRILLALSVVLWHVQGQHPRLLNASVAVLLFFVISGFYMALVINEKVPLYWGSAISGHSQRYTHSAATN